MRWNHRYRAIEDVLRDADNIIVIEREGYEKFVGSSFQFHLKNIDIKLVSSFVGSCFKRGVELKWFGAEEPNAFTSRYDSWKYIAEMPHLASTLKVLSSTCDMRVPLTFSESDCKSIAEIIVEEANKVGS